MDVRLYVVPASHPSSTASLMLEHKSIPYKRIDLMPVVSRGILKLMRFPGVTVPSLKIDGRRITGSREIARELQRLRPEPPLFPGGSSPGDRAAPGGRARDAPRALLRGPNAARTSSGLARAVARAACRRLEHADPLDTLPGAERRQRPVEPGPVR
jgi:Glutathione S-transferase, N-terminal domain